MTCIVVYCMYTVSVTINYFPLEQNVGVGLHKHIQKNGTYSFIVIDYYM